jgi:hypothetical protein
VKVGVLQVVLVEDQAADGDLTRHPHLAGEAQPGLKRSRPATERSLGPAARRRGTVHHHGAAGRADGVATAGVGEGIGAESRRQDRLGDAALDDDLVGGRRRPPRLSGRWRRARAGDPPTRG